MWFDAIDVESSALLSITVPVHFHLTQNTGEMYRLNC